MTDRMMGLFLVKLKVIALVLMLTLLSLLTFSFTTSRTLADDIWKQLGISKVDGTDAVKQSFLNGYLYYYGARNAKNLAVGNRAAVAKDLLAYTKQYVNSDAFKKEYDHMRSSAKPEAPTQKVRTKEEIRKEQIAETEKSIKSSEEISKMSAEMAKAMKSNIELFKKNLQEYKDPKNSMIEAMYQNELREEQDRQRSYTERTAQWEKNFPANYKERIKANLQKFLTLAATVDFKAELKQVGNKKKFVNPAYEGKAYDWKQVYRSGKEVYDVAKPFAEQWISELK